MRAVDVIRKKRDGGELNSAEIASFVRGATTGDGWADYQLSALLMAVVWRGMTLDETATLTGLMANSGSRLDLSDIPGPKVDKHSTGGVGDKTSLILGPLAAACGVVVPMMSGRGLGHTGGTLDKLESIPGFNVNLDEAAFRTALREVGLGMIGQTSSIAPADKKLYALRDVTATVESVPLITGSILSKKLAEGISGLVMDVKCGRGAFMKTRQDALRLAESLHEVGTANGLRIATVITAMESPLGRAVGNSLEVIESIETLKGRGPKDLTDLSALLAARMVKLAGLAKDDAEADAKVRTALDSGAGLEVFRKCIEQQGGDPKVIDEYQRFTAAPRCEDVATSIGGFIASLHAEKIGVAAMRLGAGRAKAEDRVDHAVGITLLTKPGDFVNPRDPLFTIHYRDEAKLADAIRLLEEAVVFSDSPPDAQPLVLEELG
jgi:pyrimidine-nucleoside phosphorylase